MERFHDLQSMDTSLVRGKSYLEVNTHNQELSNITKQIESCAPTTREPQQNLTRGERTALQTLKDTDDIIIKKADKGNVLVVMDTTFYRDKLVLNDHLNTRSYGKVSEDADKKVFKNLKTLLNRHEKCLTKKEQSYILNDK